MIARPKLSQNEWKTTEIRASKVGNLSPFSCPGLHHVRLRRRRALGRGRRRAWVYTAGSKILVAFRVDDAVNATPVHFFAGAWGLLAPAFFARPENMRAAYGNHSRAGLFYTGDFAMLGCQALALVSITAWVVALMFPFFFMMNKFGLFRVPEDMEQEGLDSSKHGGSAYGFDLSPQIAGAKTAADKV